MIPLTVFIALVYLFLKKRIYISEVLYEEYLHKYSVELECKKLLNEFKQGELGEFPVDKLHKPWLKTLTINSTESIKANKSKKWI